MAVGVQKRHFVRKVRPNNKSRTNDALLSHGRQARRTIAHLTCNKPLTLPAAPKTNNHNRKSVPLLRPRRKCMSPSLIVNSSVDITALISKHQCWMLKVARSPTTQVLRALSTLRTTQPNRSLTTTEDVPGTCLPSAIAARRRSSKYEVRSGDRVTAVGQ